jgi:hypothetical protein
MYHSLNIIFSVFPGARADQGDKTAAAEPPDIITVF